MTTETVLLAISVGGVEGATDASDYVCSVAPTVGPYPGTGTGTEPYVDSWWVASDARTDRSDCDSAVFVHPGHQRAAARVLHALGFTAHYNVPPADRPTTYTADPADRDGYLSADDAAALLRILPTVARTEAGPLSRLSLLLHALIEEGTNA